MLTQIMRAAHSGWFEDAHPIAAVVRAAGGTQQHRAARWYWNRSVSNVSPAALQLGGFLAVIYVGRRTRLAARHRHCGAKRQK